VSQLGKQEGILFNRNTSRAIDSMQKYNKMMHTSFPLLKNTSMISKKILCLIAVPFLNVFAAQEVNLLPEGSFSSADSVVVHPQKQEGSWTLHPGDYENHGISFKLGEEEGRNFLSITATNAAGGSTWVDTSLMLPDPKPVQVRVSFRVRTKDLVLADPAGPEWLSAQVQIRNLNDAGEEKSNAIVYRVKESSADWSEVEQIVPVSPEATKLFIQAGLWGHTGTFEIADFKIIPE